MLKTITNAVNKQNNVTKFLQILKFKKKPPKFDGTTGA